MPPKPRKSKSSASSSWTPARRKAHGRKIKAAKTIAAGKRRLKALALEHDATVRTTRTDTAQPNGSIAVLVQFPVAQLEDIAKAAIAQYLEGRKLSISGD